MKKTTSTAITVIAVILFTACTKNVDRPSGNANTTSSVVSTKNMATAIKKPIGFTGSTSMGDSTKTMTQP